MWVPGLEPPWPEGRAAIVGVVFCVVALIIGHAIFSKRGRTAPDRARLALLSQWAGCASLLASLALCATYISAYSLYVVTDVKVEGEREVQIRRVIGAELRDPKNAGQLEQALLLDNQFEEDRVWTRQSLTRTRLLVLFSYAGMFFFLALGLCAVGQSYVREADIAPAETMPRDTR